MNDQTKNIIIALVVILLIAGGVYYSNKQKSITNKEEPGILDENNTETPITNESDTSVNIEEVQPIVDKGESDTTAQSKVKFNTAMENARTAFGKGEYDQAIVFYNQALLYYKTDKVYSGLFVVYSAQNNIDKARVALDTAIKLNSTYTEYWIWKIVLLDEKTNVSFIDLKAIYQEALTKTDPRSKINLVTSFARIAENNKENKEAIALWEYAKEINPSKSAIYQQEIDRLNSLK